MKRLISLSIFVLIIISVCNLQAQNLIKNTSVTGVCYAGKKITRIYVPPPDEFYKRAGSKGGGSITIYYTGFPTQARQALDFAASILESMLPADTRFTINASWEKMSASGTLGQSTITGYAAGWGIDALNPMAIYPVALAEKITGKSLNDDLQGDLQLAINSAQTWYMGTDGQTPANKYDLVTVALHEICHGIGFFDSFNIDGTFGRYGGSGTVPMIYDTFVENSVGDRLTDTLKFLNPSSELGSLLTGDKLYFNGPLLRKYSVNNNLSIIRAKLWAPAIWDPGSSISHLDESATLSKNGLMTPFIDYGEAIHDPGKLTFSILGDLGWINTRIIHTPRHDTEEPLTQVELSATIKSDTLYMHDKVGVVFSFDNFVSSDTLFLNSQNSDDIFSTIINIPSYNSELQYYFFVEDCFLRIYRSPSLIKNIRYRVYIGTDTIKPVITHTPPDYYTQAIDSIGINTTVTDNTGVDSVYIELKVNTGTPEFIGLKRGKLNSFSNIINARPLLLRGGDSIQYRIFASDSAKVANTSVLPDTGYFVIKIEHILSTLKSYSTDFSNASTDFLNIGFDILKPQGFSKFGLNTKHPYESPNADGKSIEYTAMLRYPLKLDESGMLINYNEVVLVEPGATGSLFGSPDFYDYVIVEASKNFGRTWFGLTDGYDSHYSSSWESAYNSSIVDDNSTFIGTESMLQKHTIYIHPTESVSTGDTLLLRFRLYSDPYANGWGWVIEDLKINPLIDAVEKVNSYQVKVYPNPGNGLINIGTVETSSENKKPLRYSIYNSAGICITNNRTLINSGTLVDITGYPSGIYIIVLYRDDGIMKIKYSLIK